MPDKVYRTAIYCRLSREDGDKVESNSIASQRAICEDYIARHDDLELVCEPFVDDGYSGVSFNRPQFKKLEEAIRKGALDCIVVKDLSRFSRNYIDGGRYIEKIFPQLGIRFIAINDAYDSLTGDPQSDSFVIPFKNLINDSYCKDISMKIRSSLEVKQKSGEFVGSFAPYGYMKSPENKNQLIVDEAVSEYVQMIFSMYKDGFSIGRIAKRLNQMGVLSPMEYKHSAGVKFDTVFKTGDIPFSLSSRCFLIGSCLLRTCFFCEKPAPCLHFRKAGGDIFTQMSLLSARRPPGSWPAAASDPQRSPAFSPGPAAGLPDDTGPSSACRPFQRTARAPG